jgi:RNA polymerase sigma factor (sigma-70 family)
VLLYRRRRGRQCRLLDQYAQSRGGQCELSSTPDPLAYLIRDERGELIRKALARLPRRDAEILLLKYTEDWSYRELAAHLGVSESAVEARAAPGTQATSRSNCQHRHERGALNEPATGKQRTWELWR